MKYAACNDTIKHTAQYENQKHEHCGTSSLTWQHLMYSMAVQPSLCLIQHHAMKPYGGGGSMGPHVHLNTRQTKCGCLTAPATSPQVPHELEAGRTSEAPSMLWTPQKFVPMPEFEPQFLGHAAHSPDATMTDLSHLPSSLVTQCTAQPFMNSKQWLTESKNFSQFWEHSLSIHKKPELTPILSQLNPISKLTLYERFTFSHLYLWCPSGICNSVSLAKILYWFLVSPMNSICPPHLSLLHLVTMGLSTEQYTSSLQFSTSPNDSKHQVKNFTQAAQHFWCIHSPLSNHLHDHKTHRNSTLLHFLLQVLL